MMCKKTGVTLIISENTFSKEVYKEVPLKCFANCNFTADIKMKLKFAENYLLEEVFLCSKHVRYTRIFFFKQAYSYITKNMKYF